MGFTAEDIQEALDSGCANLEQVLDLLTNSKSSSNPNALTLRPSIKAGNRPIDDSSSTSIADPENEIDSPGQADLLIESKVINTPEHIVMEMQKKEAEETRRKLLEEKRQDAELKERLRRDIEEDKKMRAQKNQVEPTVSSSSEQKPALNQPSNPSNQDYVFKLSIARTRPIIIKLPNSANLGDLCGEIQKQIVNVRDCSSRSLASDCITITQGDWPRKPFVKPQNNADRLKKLTDLEFPLQCPLFLDHKKCIHRSEPEPTIEPADNEVNAPMEISDEDSEEEMEDRPANPLPFLPMPLLPGMDPLPVHGGTTLGGISVTDSSAANAASVFHSIC
ncbi:hypothetical protein Ciccas_003394 [Cichlidogyrus casuarinus]|uniref:UBA domain-containing protein n=1 Tax=Cichlidogyrus casuarinus TaxID=1844966 RepID=A0ABD2QEI1_9PLAT